MIQLILFVVFTHFEFASKSLHVGEVPWVLDFVFCVQHHDFIFYSQYFIS